MSLEPVTSAMSSHYAETVKTEPARQSEKMVEERVPATAAGTGLNSVEIVPVMENETKQNEKGDQQDGRKQPSEKTIKAAVSQANNHLKQSRTKCAFSYDDVTNRVSIKVYDADTEEVIREIPPEESLELVEKMWEMAGIIVDEKR